MRGGTRALQAHADGGALLTERPKNREREREREREEHLPPPCLLPAPLLQRLQRNELRKLVSLVVRRGARPPRGAEASARAPPALGRLRAPPRLRICSGCLLWGFRARGPNGPRDRWRCGLTGVGGHGHRGGTFLRGAGQAATLRTGGCTLGSRLGGATERPTCCR